MHTHTATFHGVSRATALSLIWNDTHTDFRSSKGYPRSILTPRGLVALDKLTDDEILVRTASAIRFKNHRGFVQLGLTVNPNPSRSWCGAIDQNGGAFVVNLLTGESRKVSDHSDKRTHDARLTAAFMASEAEADRIAKAARNG
ncbi:hypothetical protein [Dyella ginsengisoli]|uniref:hypothetical protein n=1 Tax=Dyella ginsengisoli TaxID=363848 RepID=UPI000349891D|nr:hypothetical protein [Dyella ginsengisoli]